MKGHEILIKFAGTQFSQFGCPATRVNRHTVFKKGKCIVCDGNKVR